MALPLLSPSLSPVQIEMLVALQKQVDELRVKHDSTLVGNEALRGRIETTAKEVEDYRKQLEEKESKNRQTLKNILDSMKKDQNALGRQVSFYDGQSARLKVALSETEVQLNALLATVQYFENKVDLLDQQIASEVEDITGGPENPVLVAATQILADRFINEKSPGFEAVRSLIMKDQEIVDEEDEETSEAGK